MVYGGGSLKFQRGGVRNGFNMARFTNMVILPFIALVLVVMALTNIFFIMPDTNKQQSLQNEVRQLSEKPSPSNQLPMDLRTLSAKEAIESSQAQSYDIPSDLQHQKTIPKQFEKDDIEDDSAHVKQFNKWEKVEGLEGGVISSIPKDASPNTVSTPPADNDLEMNSKTDADEQQLISQNQPKNSKLPSKQYDESETSPVKIVPKQNPLTQQEIISGGWRLTPTQLQAISSLPNAEVVSWKSPHAIILRNVVTEEECKYLMNQAEPALTRSRVVAEPEKQTSQARTSYGAFLNGQYRDSVVREIEERVHKLIQIPYEFGESLYVLRYQQDQKYDPHMDYCARAGQVARDECQKFLMRAGGPQCGEGHGGATCGDRLLTAIIYLSKATKGGETVFPKANGITYNDPQRACHDDNVLKVAPNAGDIILFWNYVPKVSDEQALTYTRSGSYETGDTDTEALPDPAAVHGACPVIEGEKWVVTRWIRSATFK
eukprot:TRINITY_DN2204_c1_g1_i1.p1 TRINITY_DN2204_c1_g1~~TRINITY_DN2204_c1_g1_i1.p1  ORF type:complete len:520 (-),score=53.58 TRINITY_DN2204_c1_g1_i1:917-2380(-)